MLRAVRETKRDGSKLRLEGHDGELRFLGECKGLPGLVSIRGTRAWSRFLRETNAIDASLEGP